MKNNQDKPSYAKATEDKYESLIIFKCNCRCVMCSVGMQLDRSVDSCDYHAVRPFEDIKKDIDRAKENNASAFAFSGGEPAIRKDLVDLVKYAHDTGLEHIEVQSNGRVYANMDYARRLVEAGVNSFVISFHSPVEEINDKIMGVPGSFKEQVEGIKNLNKLDQKVKINIVLTQYNYKDLLEHVNLLMKNFLIAEFRFTFVLVEGYAKDDPENIIPKMSEVGTEICKAIEVAKDKVACFVYNMVPCLVGGYEEYINDMGSFNTRLIGPEFETSLDDAKSNDKIKGDQCKYCKYNNCCTGVWNNYAELYGLGELKQIT